MVANSYPKEMSNIETLEFYNSTDFWFFKAPNLNFSRDFIIFGVDLSRSAQFMDFRNLQCDVVSTPRDGSKLKIPDTQYSK